MPKWSLRFHRDAETGLPHIYQHVVTEDEIRQILAPPGAEFAGQSDSRIALGQTIAGRYFEVVYVPDDDGAGAFVVTAYPLVGRALKA
jgi:hypothetical protein